MKHALGNVYRIGGFRYILSPAGQDSDLFRIALIGIDSCVFGVPVFKYCSVYHYSNILDSDFQSLVDYDDDSYYHWEFLGTIDIDSIKIKAPKP